MYESSDLRKGLKIEYEGDPYIVVQFDFVKPGKGNAAFQTRNPLHWAHIELTQRAMEAAEAHLLLGRLHLRAGR